MVWLQIFKNLVTGANGGFTPHRLDEVIRRSQPKRVEISQTHHLYGSAAAKLFLRARSAKAEVAE